MSSERRRTMRKEPIAPNQAHTELDVRKLQAHVAQGRDRSSNRARSGPC